MDERMRFVMELSSQEVSFAMACRQAGVSRKTGYKWKVRYDEEGVAGLVDRSRAPLHHPHAIAPEIAEACLELRRRHPTWGPVKVHGRLSADFPEAPWPAVSTIGELFDREGLTVKRKLRRRGPPSSLPFAPCVEPNDVWCMDFKGWFLTGDGARCGPLTMMDATSRYLLRCQVVTRPDFHHVWPVLEAALREFGLPSRMRSDNGPPFASSGAGGLSELAVRLIKAGVTPERIKPGKPQQNGRLERFHLTLLQDTASPPARSLRAQLERFAAFRQLYNEARPHQALGNRTPAQAYAPSPRRFDGVLREPQYGADYQVRRARSDGAIKWRGAFIYLNAVLAGEPVGLLEDEHGHWTVSYGPVVLGKIDPKGERLLRPRRTRGLVDNPGGLPTTPPVQRQQAS